MDSDYDSVLDWGHLPDELKLAILDKFDLAELLVLAQVNRFWRSLTLQCPAYWKVLRIQRDSDNAVNLFLARLNSSRHGGLMIDVEIRSTDPAAASTISDRVIPALAPERRRIVTLKISVPARLFPVVCTALDGPATILESLILDMFRTHADPKCVLPVNILGGDCPTLKKARLHLVRMPDAGVGALRYLDSYVHSGTSRDRWNLSELLHFPTLTRLSVGRCNVQCVDLNSPIGLATLRAFRQLTHLRITVVRREPTLVSQLPASIFSSIPEVTIYDGSAYEVGILLDSMPRGPLELEVGLCRDPLPESAMRAVYDPLNTTRGTRVKPPPGSKQRNCFLTDRWADDADIAAFFPSSVIARVERFAFVLGRAEDTLGLLQHVGPLETCRTLVLRPAKLAAEPAARWPPPRPEVIPRIVAPKLQCVEIAPRPDDSERLEVQADELAGLLDGLLERRDGQNRLMLLMPTDTIRLVGDDRPLRDRYNVVYVSA